MRAQDMRKLVSHEEAAHIAAGSMNVAQENVRLVAPPIKCGYFRRKYERKWRMFNKHRRPVRAVDREGVIRIQRSDGVIMQAPAAASLQQLRALWEAVTIYNGDSVIAPDMFVIAGRRIVDLCGITVLEQAIAVSRGEIEGLSPETPVVLIGMQGARGL